jgi:hypothetical protein
LSLNFHRFSPSVTGTIHSEGMCDSVATSCCSDSAGQAPEEAEVSFPLKRRRLSFGTESEEHTQRRRPWEQVESIKNEKFFDFWYELAMLYRQKEELVEQRDLLDERLYSTRIKVEHAKRIYEQSAASNDSCLSTDLKKWEELSKVKIQLEKDLRAAQHTLNCIESRIVYLAMVVLKIARAQIT